MPELKATPVYKVEDVEKKEFSAQKTVDIKYDKEVLELKKAAYVKEVERLDALLVEAGKLGL